MRIMLRKAFSRLGLADGMLTAGFISAVIGNQLPGPGSIYIKQELNFLAPVRIGDTITARVEIIEIIAEKIRIRLKTTCNNQNGVLILTGEAVIKPVQSA